MGSLFCANFAPRPLERIHIKVRSSHTRSRETLQIWRSKAVRNRKYSSVKTKSSFPFLNQNSCTKHIWNAKQELYLVEKIIANGEFSIYLYIGSVKLYYNQNGGEIQTVLQKPILVQNVWVKNTQTTSNNDLKNYKKRARFGEENEHTQAKPFFCVTCDETRFKAYKMCTSQPVWLKKFINTHKHVEIFFSKLD